MSAAVLIKDDLDGVTEVAPPADAAVMPVAPVAETKPARRL